MPRRGSLAHWAICALIIWAVASAIWVPLILWSGILDPLIDWLNALQGVEAFGFHGGATLMHMKLSIAFAGVQGLALLAAGLGAMIVKAPGLPGWAVLVIAVLASTLGAAFSTPPDILVQLAFMGCVFGGTVLGLRWGRAPLRSGE